MIPDVTDDDLQVGEMLSHDEHNIYRSVVERWIYLATKTSLDLALTASALGSHVAKPRQTHMSLARRGLQYLNARKQKIFILKPRGFKSNQGTHRCQLGIIDGTQQTESHGNSCVLRRSCNLHQQLHSKASDAQFIRILDRGVVRGLSSNPMVKTSIKRVRCRTRTYKDSSRKYGRNHEGNRRPRKTLCQKTISISVIIMLWTCRTSATFDSYRYPPNKWEPSFWQKRMVEKNLMRWLCIRNV